MSNQALAEVILTSLPKLATGKVRDLYDVDDNTLLFVTSDRISAYDVIMKNGIPHKGEILTLLSAHWFNELPKRVPGLRTHFLATDVPSNVTIEEARVIRNRSMQVRKLKVFPLEAIVRGYVTGGAWKEYKDQGTVHGMRLPPGLKQCDAVPGGPIYTPSTKAPAGQHDENISKEEAAKIVGDRYAKRIEELALKIFIAGQEYATERGIIIADTKFEFGLDEVTDEVVLVDEVLTPDSSRMWPKDRYEPGRDQESFDKQFLRNWLTENGLQGKEGVEVPQDVLEATSKRYLEVFQRLTGKSLEETTLG
ncbi:phosphoribosylaminoimidazole-succinocarboxamide synthase [Hypoxylon trugodes]|uniref:phosphoribosylaminoimidazole-succinocarboxamide synthase n=1 Tax=Hypoxylon trugodes TaxID=326681 RepID=UPI00218F998A|nr:phosphoribosylaminoimidazole-succinocarboxamide synthase [Hypoxylon trugodes]KAI1391950.1 phosphoribosylaminoimidazole-succinocarboxamide synthase [Hypoxylon trugodes]